MSKTLGGENELTDISSITYVAGSTVVHEQAIDGGTEYNFNLPLDPGTPGDLLTSAGGDSNAMTWTSASFGTGTVTSVNVTTPTFMTSSGGPITTTGTITLGLSGTPLPVANGGTGTTTSTGTGSTVRSIAPTFTGITTIDTLDLIQPLGVVEGGTGVQTATGTGDTVRNTAPTMINTNLTGTTVSPGILNVTNTTASTSTATGALTIGGGVGIVGDLNVGGSITGTAAVASLSTTGTITTSNATQSVGVNSGAIVATSVTGGLGIGGNANIGGTLKTFNTTNSTTTTTGALQSAGGLGVVSNANVGGTITANGMTTTSLTASARITGNQIYTTPLTLPNGVTTVLTITSPTRIVLQGATGAGLTLPAANLLPLEYTYTVRNISLGVLQLNNGTPSFLTNIGPGGTVQITLSTNSTVAGSWTLNYLAPPTVSWDNGTAADGLITPTLIQSTNTTNSTSSSTGSIRTNGGLGVALNVNVGGNIRVKSTAGGQIGIIPNVDEAERSILYQGLASTTGSTDWYAGVNVGSGTNHWGLFSGTYGLVQKWPATAVGFSTEILGGGLSIEPGFGISTNSGTDTFTYETGTWTPTLAGSVTYTVQTGHYIQSGKEIKATFTVTFSVTAAGARLKITNLPFACSATGSGVATIFTSGFIITDPPKPYSGVQTVSSTEIQLFDREDDLIFLDATWVNVTIRGIMVYFVP